MQASLDYAQSLLHAKDLTEVMRLHSEYVQAQMRALAEQASEMGQIVEPGGDGCRQAEKLSLLFPPPCGEAGWGCHKLSARGLHPHIVRCAHNVPP